MSHSKMCFHRLITVFCCSTVVALFYVPVLAQHFTPATATNAKQFVGVWEASFQGSPFLTVTIAIDGNKLVGKLSHFDVEVNKAGELTKAEAGDGDDAITTFRVDGDTLRITTKSTDGSENSIQTDMRMVASNEADLRLLAPPDVPVPKPWRLKRVRIKP